MVMTSLTNVIVFTLYSIISADPCPSPCWCVDDNTTVVCNMTGIKEIPKGLPRNTITLLLRRNEIEFIPKTAFIGLYQLKHIDLFGNKLHDGSIATGAFDLESIQTLDLSANLFKQMPPEVPPKLTTLTFWYNPITTLTDNSFVNYTSVKYLSLLANQIDSIGENVFVPMSNLTQIDLSSNKLGDGSIKPSSFINTNISSLKLNYNMFTMILNKQYLPRSLTVLELYGNKIKHIPSKAFSTLEYLENLAVAQGGYTTIANSAFVGLNNLKNLDLSQSNISGLITNLTFTGLVSLESLSLDINGISEIESGAFYALKKVKEVGLSGNKLKTLNPAVLNTKFLSKLSSVYIYGNPWICDCHLKWLREKMNNATYRVASPDLTTCAGPPNLKGKTWAEVQPGDFVCK